MSATEDATMCRPSLMVADRFLRVLPYDQATSASSMDFEQLDESLTELGLTAFGLDLTLKVCKSPDLQVLLERAKALIIDYATCMEQCDANYAAYDHARYQVSMLQGNNEQLMEALRAAHTAAADATQKAAVLDGQLQDVLQRLHESAGADISRGLRLSAIQADLEETPRELRETQVRVDMLNSDLAITRTDKLELEDCLSTAHQHLSSQDKAVARLEQQLAEKGAQLERSEQQLAEQDAQLEREQEQARARERVLQDELAAVRGPLQSSRADQLATWTCSVETQEQLQESRSKIEQADLEISALHQRLEQSHHSLEQVHASNAALQDALYRECAHNTLQEERHWANTAAFIKSLQQERARSEAHQQDLAALQDKMTASPAQPEPTSVSLPGGFLGLAIYHRDHSRGCGHSRTHGRRHLIQWSPHRKGAGDSAHPLPPLPCEWQQDPKLHGATWTGTGCRAAVGMLAAVGLIEHQVCERDPREH